MLTVTPLAVEHIAPAEQRPKIERVAGSPAFQQLKLTLTRSAREVMATTLQPQPPGWIKADAAVRTVHLLLDDQILPGEFTPRRNLDSVVPSLDARSSDMASARVF